MKAMNAVYAQSGGVTSVINATAFGVIEGARKSKKINKLYAGKDGILFPITIDTSRSAIKIIEDASKLSVVDLVDSHNTGTKDMLKSKWKEITSSV